MPNKMAYCRNKELPEKVNQLPGLHNKSHLHFQIFICTRGSRGIVLLKIHLLEMLANQP